MMILEFYRSTIGKKFAVALSGLFLLFFALGHMAGNLKIFAGPGTADHPSKIDLYAEFLRTFGSDIFGYTGFLWIFRVLLIAAVVIHIVSILQLRAINKRARGDDYKVVKKSFSTRIISLMFVGGLIVAFFIVFHIFHMTLGTIHSNFEHGAVYSNIYTAFENPLISLLYIISVSFLGLHLYHGAWSVFQTLGINSEKYNDYYRLFAKGTAVAITLGFAIVPIAILTGFLSAP